METQTIKSKKVSPRKSFSLAFKKKVVADYERGFLNKDQLQIEAYQKLIEITEAEEKTSILKKDVAKQSVSSPNPTQEK